MAQVLATGDQKAFQLLVQRHQGRIRGLMRHLARNDASADDLAQEAFLLAWEKLSTFSGTGSFAAWLSKIAYTRFLQFYRRKKVEAKYLSTTDTPTHFTPTMDMDMDFEKMVGFCSKDEQTLLTLSYVVGLSNTEIGEVLNLPTGTIKSQIHRAKKKIINRLGSEIE